MNQIWKYQIYFGRSISSVPNKSIILFPCYHNRFFCGLAGIVAFKNIKKSQEPYDIDSLETSVRKMEDYNLLACQNEKLHLEDYYLGGTRLLQKMSHICGYLKRGVAFYEIFTDQEILTRVERIKIAVYKIIHKEEILLARHIGLLDVHSVNVIYQFLENLKDVAWCLSFEILDNIKKIRNLMEPSLKKVSPGTLIIFKNINSLLNSIDRLEVRGRDSAGISLMFVLEKGEFEKFKNILTNKNSAGFDINGSDLINSFVARSGKAGLGNMDIDVSDIYDHEGKNFVNVTFTYKIAAEIGKLGDNIAFIRQQIKKDLIFQIIVNFPSVYHTILSHTRWASVGAITEQNCHPLDNMLSTRTINKTGIIHVCLNGDIDNFLDLKSDYESQGISIPADITTDTKIIPLIIEKYVKEGNNILEAFRKSVNDFTGSHAIVMHTSLAPGKVFLAQKGSGQAIFVGIAEDLYMPASEVYGFVEETPYFIKIDGEKKHEGKFGQIQGQIFVLDQDPKSELQGIYAILYDGTPLQLDEKDIKSTEITSRDTDRQNFSHYFLKEITESPDSVQKTLNNRWKINNQNPLQYILTLDEKIIPYSIQEALKYGKIRRIIFIGQGTAGVAALSCADILAYYMNDPAMYILAMKSSELSGFQMGDTYNSRNLSDSLVIAISQSGTTTDTNRAIDMAKERGAYTIAIVNRRDSDLTFKVDGVMYTSSGRDIEMSVASTKAYYAQIIAGALLSLYFAHLREFRNDDFISTEIKRLIEIPDKMRQILLKKDKIEKSAKRLSIARTYWAIVGSGPNKASADEIRIKLSELCYKTISSDYIEDKKHIDLSSEPLIIVCAAGVRDTVIGDIIKDTAIFKAHKAIVIVIANEGEERFAPIADEVMHVPIVIEPLAPILNTLVGHLFGYHAALTIHESSSFLHNFREDIYLAIDMYSKKGLDIYELILEKSFREKIVRFYEEFICRKREHRFPSFMDPESISDLTLILKYLAGRLPIGDFELDFGVKGTPKHMLETLFRCLNYSISVLARPIDAIKHQAKTVTVGTSRLAEKLEGLIFDTLSDNLFKTSQLTPNNIIVIKNFQGIISEIKGITIYEIEGLNLLGEPADETTIKVISQSGTSENIVSRINIDPRLAGTKRIIVRQGNVYIGQGRKDNRNIVIIPIMSAVPSTVNMIKYLILLHIAFKENVPLFTKIKALGGKFEHIKNIVQENIPKWDDTYIELMDIKELFGRSAEKIAEKIVAIQKL